jgi:hypothetical protein
MIEVRALPHLEVGEWSQIVRVPLEPARGGVAPTALVVLLGAMTAILAAIVAFA